MKRIRVLLRDHVQDLGRCGDVVNVTPGYARNYLLPNNIAVPATPENVRTMQRRRARLEAEEAAVLADVRRRVQELSAVSVSTTERADEGGRLFGSVSAAAIAKLLADRGIEVDERDVRLSHALKAVGIHDVAVHVHGEHSATIKVEVVAAS